jgi:PAS domain S-box-containing protein
LLYALPVVLVLLATIVTKSLEPQLGETISPLFFAAVMLSAWTGGLGPGLLATALAGWASAYYFPNNPPGSGMFSWDDGIRLAVFFMVSLLISSLTSLRKRAQVELQRSLEGLEQRVQERTRELRSSNERLRESEEKFRALVEGVNDYAIIMLDAQGRIVSWNAGAGRIEGYSHDEVVGQHVSRFFPPDAERRREAAGHLEVAAAQGRHEDEGWRVRKDGSRFWANVITTALRDESGNLRGFAQVTRDVTELRNLEREVLQISEAQLRRIGHDLHDGLGQELTGIALLAQDLTARLVSCDAPQATESQRIVALVNAAIEQTRDVARGFAPVELGPDGLRAALHALAAKVEGMAGIPCRFRCSGNASVDDEAALHLYRIAQEALNNAVRHSGATRVDVVLEQTCEALTLTISDDGRGFLAGAACEKGDDGGMGLVVMQYRARMIGARWEIGAGPSNRGTMVKCVYTGQRGGGCGDAAAEGPPPEQRQRAFNQEASAAEEVHAEFAVEKP